ncbi:hypothetical protein BH09PLA1_BH09PLA1_24360 [soil metagenome]
MPRMRNPILLRVLLVLCAMASALVATAVIGPAARAQSDSPATKPADSAGGPWHKIKSADGHTKPKPIAVKFQPATSKWRLTISTSADKEKNGRDNPSSNVRAELMIETKRDVSDKPVNWSQVEIIRNGKVGAPDIRTYDNGLDKDGKPRWFQLMITGYLAEYTVIIEDQSADDSAKAKTKKKKKSDD